MELDNNQFLRSIILNNSLQPQIQFFRDRLGHFDHLETVPFMIKFESLKALTLELVNNAFDKAISKRRRDSDKFFEELNRDIDNDNNNNDNDDNNNINNNFNKIINNNEKPKGVLESSSSLDFLENTTTMDQTAEKQRADQFFFNNSQSELAVTRC